MRHTKPIATRYLNALLHVVGMTTILLTIIGSLKIIMWVCNV